MKESGLKSQKEAHRRCVHGEQELLDDQSSTELAVELFKVLR